MSSRSRSMPSPRRALTNAVRSDDGWRAGVVGQQVDLVEGRDPRRRPGAELVEHRLHRGLLAEKVRIGGIHDLDQQVGTDDFLERGAERVDQVVRQLVDETDRIGHDDVPPARQTDLPAGRVERGEQHVGDVDVRIGHGVEQRALAGVGVADEGHGGDLAMVAATRGGGAVAADVVEIGADLLDPFADEPTVGLELALAGPSRADPATRARQVRPHPRQPRQVVLQRGELDLEPALLGPRVAGEDVDDQRGAIEHLAVEELLEAALLVRLELVVDDEHVEVGRCALVHELGGAAAAEIPHGIRARPSLRRGAHHDGPCGLGQGAELLERPRDRPPSVGWVVEPDQEGALVGGGEVDHASAFGHLFDPW